MPVPVRNTSNDICMILKGSVKKKIGIPNRARMREIIARYLLRLILNGFLLPLRLPISEARSQTAPAGHMYLHTHLLLKNVISSAITPSAFNHTRLFWLRKESRNIYGLTQRNSPVRPFRGRARVRVASVHAGRQPTPHPIPLSEGERADRSGPLSLSGRGLG